MRDDEWLDHGPASINLLLERQSERDNLHKLCAGTIAAMWAKDATAATFFPEIIPPKTPEEIKEEKREQFRLMRERIKSAARKNAEKNGKHGKLENRGSKGT